MADSRNTTVSRRGLLVGSLAGTAAGELSNAASAHVPSPDAELLRLLRGAARLESEDRALFDARPDPQLDEAGWLASHHAGAALRAQRDVLLRQAALLPALTIEGRTAKAMTVRDWIGGFPGATWPDHIARGDEHITWSLMQDILREASL